MGFIRGGETITILRKTAGPDDAHGNPTFTTASVTVRDALIGIGGTSEPVDPARDAVDASVTAYLPAGTVVQEGDVFVIRGTRWVKDGTAQEWVAPFTGMEVGVVVPLRKRRG